jgi:uroporphyrinogen III methyltransferase / synthase
MMGQVILVGAGPGDPGLITVRGVEALSQADVVLYDFLASSELLRHAPAHAERIYVGKRAGAHAMRQQEINQLLVDLARQGKCVVRLKGGDPFLFGRGGEEGHAVAEAGIPFEVIPGVSSAIAAPAYAGIPVTHRGVASSLAIVTGHEDPAKAESSLDWDALSRMETLVVLMGVGNLPRIVERLLALGRETTTPAALIEWGTLGRQRTVAGTLADIVERVAEAGLVSPAIIVVGDVVRLREELNWFETRPLHGLRVLVTRTQQQANKLSRALRAQGAEPVECPLIEIVPPNDWGPLDAAIRRISDYDWIILTSANAVEAFFERLWAAGLDARALAGCRLAVIGSATAGALGDRGLRADLLPDDYKAEALVEALTGLTDVAGLSMLLPHSAIARPALAEQLRERGAQIDEVAAYTNRQPEGLAHALREALREVDLVTFTSSSTVRHFVEALGAEEAANAFKERPSACIGPITAEAMREIGIEPTIVAKESTINGLVDALLVWLT